METKMKTIQLSKGYETVVDEDVYEILMNLKNSRGETQKWCAEVRTNGAYARMTYYEDGAKKGLSTYREGAISRCVPLHQFVFFLKEGKVVDGKNGVTIDHKDRNQLNNQISNLREATKQEQVINRGLRKDNTSGLKGVCWRKDNRKWVARISINGEILFLGRFECKYEAFEVYKQAHLKYFGCGVSL